MRKDAETLVIREPAGGKEIELATEEVLAMKQLAVSVMPAGLVNQLANRSQFLDLVRFLMEVNEGGTKRQAKLKKAVTSPGAQ